MSEIIADAVKSIISSIDSDPQREGLKDTPERASRALRFMTSGYQMDASSMLKKALFQEDYDQMVIVKNIEFYSLCEHHLVPFYGKAHVGYLPDGRIVGLSKIARLVDIFARRLQVQERMTRQIALALEEALQPQGVAIVVEGLHLCMMMRGVEKQNSLTITSEMLGAFRNSEKTRLEFMNLISR